MNLRIAPIVEGHGEVPAIRILLERIWMEIVAGEFVDVMRPIRKPKSKLITEKKPDELSRAVQLAVMKLTTGANKGDDLLVLILVDADADAPCLLGPNLLDRATESRRDADITCVIANIEYETWFVAAAESLGDYLRMRPDEAIPNEPESERLGKGWIQKRFAGTRYSETIDQPRMTAKMDLTLCRKRSPSFDKLCRELEQRRSDSPIIPQ